MHRRERRRRHAIPTLKRIELTSNGVSSVVSLVEGIENLQLDYGVDADKDGVPDTTYTTDPASVAAWMNVVAVRINLLSRQIEPTNGYTDPRTYDMGVAGAYTPAARTSATSTNTVVRVVNPASRREP
jgi:type IV pilus assembly protein PilW